ILSAVLEETAPYFCANINPREHYTSMAMAHSCRMMTGPARNVELHSLVNLVPHERMNKDPNSRQLWMSKGDLNRMLDTYKDFP
ncbi:hypothetical protein DOTSEDRAFT_112758, partial [Dothistroma septosporum NZE10]